jgi:hypothetical protein
MTVVMHPTIHTTCNVEPFGKSFTRLVKRAETKRTITEDEELEEAFQEALQSDTVNDDNSGYDDFESDKLLRSGTY